MNINGAFPSDYLKESDLQGKTFTMTMGRVEIAKLGDDQKPILYFQGAEKGLALNKTNANTIADAYGPETDNWHGKKLEVYPSETDYQGKRVPCIRVRIPRDGGQQAPESYGGNPNLPAAGGAADLNDEVPFAPLRELP